MNRHSRFLSPLLLAVFCTIAVGLAPVEAQSNHWVMAYFPSWELGDGTNSNPPLSAVDFSAMTEVAYFGFNPEPNGEIDTVSTGANYKGAHALMQAAAPAGTNVIMSIGGWNTGSEFEGATSPGNLITFVKNIVSIVRNFGYEGVDIDWEPLTSADYTQFANLIKALRVSLPHPYILTVATGWGGAQAITPIYKYVDQINLMTYDLMGAWQGWVTWFNSAVYSNGITVAFSKSVPSCDIIVKEFTDAGIPASKLGIGAELSGTIWKGGVMANGTGVTGPDQHWITPPSVQFDVPLYWKDNSGVMQKYYSPENYHWDSGAEAPYLSVKTPSDSGDMFISYDDSASITAKINFVKTHGLGGFFLYELGWGYPGNGTYPLLEVVKHDLGKYVQAGQVPVTATLNQNYPNPFNPTTEISYTLSGDGYVTLIVYDTVGRKIETLVDGYQKAGSYSVPFESKHLASGVYVYKLQVGSDVIAKKMTLLK